MLNFALTDEQKQLIEMVARFAKDQIIPVAAQADEDEKFPDGLYKEAFELGLVAPLIPDAYGGMGCSEIDQVLIAEELAYGCMGIQTSINCATLAAMPVMLAGDEAQKKKYLGMLTSEPSFAAYAITEPGAGSDAAGIVTRATPDGDDWVLNGQKCYITNGSWSSWYIVFATIDPSLRHKGIMAFIVDRDSAGLSVGKKERKLGQRASDTATIIFEDVKVPKANVLAPAGAGFKLAMRTFDRTRPDIGAAACGLMRRCLDESLGYARERKTFGVPISNHQMIQRILADMAIQYEATRLLVHKAAWMIDEGDSSSLVASFSKAFGADSAMQVATDAVQVFGGAGYMREYPVEKLMRDAKILQIYEGTSQIQRMVIARRIVG